MTFSELWNLIQNREVVLTIRLRRDNEEIGPTEPLRGEIRENPLNHKSYIFFGDIQIISGIRRFVLQLKMGVLNISKGRNCSFE